MTLLNLLKANPTLKQPTVLALVPAVSLGDVLSVMSVIGGAHAENGCGEQVDEPELRGTAPLQTHL